MYPTYSRSTRLKSRLDNQMYDSETLQNVLKVLAVFAHPFTWKYLQCGQNCVLIYPSISIIYSSSVFGWMDPSSANTTKVFRGTRFKPWPKYRCFHGFIATFRANATLFFPISSKHFEISSDLSLMYKFQRLTPRTLRDKAAFKIQITNNYHNPTPFSTTQQLLPKLDL